MYEKRLLIFDTNEIGKLAGDNFFQC